VSFFVTASTSNVPIPCQLNTVSVMIAPARTEPKFTENRVVTGISALRNACRKMTRPLASPLARAVRT